MPAAVGSNPTSGNSILDGIDGGTRWIGTITYKRVDPTIVAETTAFVAALPSAYTTEAIGLTNAMWTIVTQALGVLRNYAAVSYEFTDTLDANYLVSDFRRPDNNDVAGIAARPSTTPIFALNVRTWDDYSDQQQAWIALHELGHTLGLTHPMGLPDVLDRTAYTIMSSRDLDDDLFGEGQPLTPMAIDVAVLQAKYGTVSANVTDTRYALSLFTVDLDGEDGGVANGAGYVCIWDTGGADTLSCSGSLGSILNLNAATLTTAAMSGDLADVIGDVAAASQIFVGLTERSRTEMTDPVRTAGGFFSSFLFAGDRDVGGYTIANGARIEAASGGRGGDLLIGNGIANTLLGNEGRDELFGGSGDDSIAGGAGFDDANGTWGLTRSPLPGARTTVSAARTATYCRAGRTTT